MVITMVDQDILLLNALNNSLKQQIYKDDVIDIGI